MLATAAGGAVTVAAAQEAAKSAFFELRYYRMRNSRTNMVQRTTAFLSKGYVPAARRAGIAPVGLFSATIAPEAPFLLVLSGYPSLGAMQASLEKLAADRVSKLLTEYLRRGPRLHPNGKHSFPVLRFGLQIGGPPPGRAARTLSCAPTKSDNEATLRRKIKMFGDGEITVFRRAGLQPVFFGEASWAPICT
jgi:hypothetical protein